MINDPGEKAYFNEIKNMEKKFTKASTDLLTLLESVDDKILPDLKGCLEKISSKKSKESESPSKSNPKDNRSSIENMIMTSNSKSQNFKTIKTAKNNDNNSKDNNITTCKEDVDNNMNSITTTSNNNGNNDNNNKNNKDNIMKMLNNDVKANVINTQNSNLDLLSSAIDMIKNDSFINNYNHSNINNDSSINPPTGVSTAPMRID